MSKRLTIIGFFLLIISINFAQDGWDWGMDKPKTQKMWFDMVDMVKMKDYTSARKNASWLLNNTPQLHRDLYIKSAEVYQTLEMTAIEGKTTVQDTVLWIYDQRIKYFGDTANVLNRKGLYAIRYKVADPNAVEKMFSLYSKIQMLNAGEMYATNAYYYMLATSNMFRYKKITENQVFGIYGQLSSYIDDKINTATDEAKLGSNRSIKKEIDNVFEGTIKLTCEKIEMLYGKEMKQDSIDVSTAKKMFSLLEKAKCTKSKHYSKMLLIINKAQPSANGYISLAEYYTSQKKYSNAEKMYQKAITYASTDIQKANTYYQLGTQAKTTGKYRKARDYFYQSINLGYNQSQAYTMIGNMYMYNSNDACNSSDMVVLRAKYIAAYDMYQKAGNQKLMEDAKKQFPSEQEIFFATKKIGGTVNTGCWINKSIILRAR